MASKETAEKKAFVRSVRMKVDSVVPGMVLAEGIRSSGGAVVIKEDTFLTADHIVRLREMCVDHVYIETCEVLKEFDPLRGKTAIVIDDSLFFRHMFAKMLYKMGMLVCGEIATGEEGVRQAELYKPDLVVVDIHLPKMDGSEAMRKLRKKLPDAKFVAVSSDKSRDTIVNAFKSGANDFMIKPIKWDVLKPRILKLFDTSTANSSN